MAFKAQLGSAVLPPPEARVGRMGDMAGQAI